MEVWRKQTLLAYLGYLPYQDIDNVWGNQTQRATEAFQRDYQITVDGIFDNGTLARILNVIATGEKLLVSENQATSYSVEDNNVPSTTGTFWDEIEFFTREEFRCKCGGKYCNGFPAEPQQLLVELADRARAHFGRPAHVVSGLRCHRWNQIQGGVVNSQHMYGEAMDIRIDGVSARELLAWMKKQPEVRYCYAINSTNVHFDIPKGRR